MGFSGEKGSSTGLHIDYHDNFYVLVKGKKRFTISCPVNADVLKTNGGATSVRKNGLITYNEEVHDDGHYSHDESDASTPDNGKMSHK